MPALDIFGSSAFTMVALTGAINKMPYVPGRYGQLSLFREQGVSTTSVMIEEREGTFELRASEVADPRPGDQLTSSARPSSFRASRSGAIPTGWCGPWTFGQPDVVRLQSGVVLCWRPQGESSDVTKSLFACLGCHLLPRRSAPSGTDRLWLERGNWRLERTDVAELGWTHRGWRLGLLRVQPCPTACSKELIQLKSGRVDSAIVGHVDRLT